MTDSQQRITAALAGRYRVDRLVGTGGMATVYLAEDERHHRRVAVKILRPELAGSIGLERFEREIGIAARLNHPHILPLLDSGTIPAEGSQPASAYYVMPFVEGESLRDRLTRDKRLDLEESIRLTREVADALDYAHHHGVIHRDIKPENILISGGHAVVADFGIARALDEASGATLTNPGVALGTPAYMSPEQVSGERTVDGHTDQYALGCMLFEMLSGQPPFTGTMTTILTRRLAEAAPRIRSVVPGVPPAVDAALARALDRDPAKRFDTPAQFAAMLGVATAPVPIVPKRRLIVRAGVALLALAAGFLAITRTAKPGRADSISSLLIAPAVPESTVAYLSDGIQDAVADLLRRLPQLRVTAPSLVAQMRRQEPAMNNLELGERLKVGAVLTWDLSRIGDSVLVKAELVRVPGGDLLLPLRYSRHKSDVASMQGDIARKITDALRLQLTGSEKATIARRPTVSAEAYELYLRARKVELRGVPLGAENAKLLMDSAAFLSHKALAIDSSFAQAQGLLGTYYFVSAFRGWRPLKEYVDSSVWASQRALEADSTLGDAWVNVISKAIYLDDNWPVAQDAASRGLRLSSHDSQVLLFGAIVLGEIGGRLDTAITLARHSVELEPVVGALNTLGDLQMRAGKYDSAAAALRRALEVDPTVPGPRRRLILSLEHLRRFDEAIAVRRDGGDSAGAASYARGLADAGPAGYELARRDDLMRQVSSQLAAASAPYRIPQDTVPQLREERLVYLYSQLGEWTRAMDWVEKLRQRRPKRFRLLALNPLYAGLRGDPRFTAMVRADGLEQLVR